MYVVWRWCKVGKDMCVSEHIYIYMNSWSCGCPVLCADWWLLSTQAYIFEWIGVRAHEQTQDGRVWDSPLQRAARLSALHRVGHTVEKHTHTHTEWHKHTPHPQIYIPTSSAWRSTCQLLPVAGRDGLCWFCEAHRQDPPGDCRSPAAQTSSLIHSAAQAICFLYCQAVSLYYAL